MTLILENYVVPEKGPVDINVTVSFEIKVTAVEARRKAGCWLFEEVSYLIGANDPVLVVGKRPAWRVPAWIGFTDAGPFTVGAVDVDVETGEVIEPDKCKADIEQHLNEDVKPQLPKVRQRIRELPADYLANLNPPPEMLAKIK